MTSTNNTASLPYHEPGIVTILITSSFLLLLNVVNYILDKIVYCGLVGQLFVGIGWGIPGANWLSVDFQHAVSQLGYLGLILIVYEGGLSSNFQALKANLFLSSAVALTGITAPIGLSFILLGLLPISPVQAFAAGAALCSTSLGTTFTVLSTSGLTESRLGVVLSSAAMMDDVVGLIMVQIISSLGAGSTFTEITVVRPVFVSIAFAVLVPLACLFVAKPAMQFFRSYLLQPEKARYRSPLCSPEAAFVYQTAILLALVTGATYAGTSNLFAAYLAGASVTWLSDSIGGDEPSSASGSTGIDEIKSAKIVYERYYQPAVESALRPFFFASIGFSIPITRMFSGRIVWRGFVYTALMTFGKVICGLWLVRFATAPRAKAISRKLASFQLPASWSKTSEQEKSEESKPFHLNSNPQQHRQSAMLQRQSSSRVHEKSTSGPDQIAPADSGPNPDIKVAANTARKRSGLPRPKSLYPAAILGSAMVSRGEIGFLISSVAESRGVFGEGGNTDAFLVVTWAVLLCTLLGPIVVGLLVKRVRRLQQMERSKANGQEDPLGIWGVLPSGTT